MSELPSGLHGAFQLAWTLAMATPVGSQVSALARHPSSAGAFGVIELSAIWALIAGVAWGLRVVALTTGGRFGAATRERTRRRSRRQGSR